MSEEGKADGEDDTRDISGDISGGDPEGAALTTDQIGDAGLPDAARNSVADPLLLNPVMDDAQARLLEPLVFLPGMMCDARLFGPQIRALGRDRPLHLPPLTQADSIEDMARGILQHAPRQFALAGLALGGIVAMEVLRQAPSRVTRVALMDTSPHPESPEMAAHREPQIARVQAGRLDDVMRDEMQPHHLAPGPHRQDVLELVLDMALELGPEVFVRQSRALQRRPDLQDALRKLSVPTLILCGAHDPVCPVARHEFMASLVPHAELVVIPNAGHLPTLEASQAVTDSMRAWLQT